MSQSTVSQSFLDVFVGRARVKVNPSVMGERLIVLKKILQM